jgi:very-short-patch-repair endonuclease
MDQLRFAKHLRQNMTEAEPLLWHHLRAHRLNDQKFRRQQPIGPYIADFVHFGARLIIEADGGQHNASASDATRDAWLKNQGFTVLRFWNNEILLNIEGVLGAVVGALGKDTSTSTPCPSPLAPLPQGERGNLNWIDKGYS